MTDQSSDAPRLKFIKGVAVGDSVVFINEATGEHGPYPVFTLNHSYRNKEGKSEATPYLKGRDLFNAIEALNIVAKEYGSREFVKRD